MRRWLRTYFSAVVDAGARRPKDGSGGGNNSYYASLLKTDNLRVPLALVVNDGELTVSIRIGSGFGWLTLLRMPDATASTAMPPACPRHPKFGSGLWPK